MPDEYDMNFIREQSKKISEMAAEYKRMGIQPKSEKPDYTKLIEDNMYRELYLDKLAEYQRVVAGAVKGGVYENDNYWWRELCRLANEQAVEQLRALDFAICAPEYHASLDEQGDRFCRMCGQPLSQ